MTHRRVDARCNDRRLPRSFRQAQPAPGHRRTARLGGRHGPERAHVVTVWQSKAHMDRWSAEQLFPAFQSLGMTDVASNMEFTEYDADELYIR
jgi:heme-degrading monooxygenase HmoA